MWCNWDECGEKSQLEEGPVDSWLVWLPQQVTGGQFFKAVASCGSGAESMWEGFRWRFSLAEEEVVVAAVCFVCLNVSYLLHPNRARLSVPVLSSEKMEREKETRDFPVWRPRQGEAAGAPKIAREGARPTYC